jgi:uncharacterized membrane-anchored protein YhcB (DUF1043 family)
MSDNTFRVVIISLLAGIFIGVIGIRMNLDQLVEILG